MAIRDSQMVLSDAQAVTSTGDTASTNVYDCGAAYDAGVGEELFINVAVDTAVTSAGAATVQAVLQTSDDNSTFTDAMAGAAIAKADLTAGVSMLKGRIPHGLGRYLRVAYRVGTAALTAGNFDAYFTKDADANTAYASGFTV